MGRLHIRQQPHRVSFNQPDIFYPVINRNDTISLPRECNITNLTGDGILHINFRNTDNFTPVLYLKDVDLRQLRFNKSRVEIIIDTATKKELLLSDYRFLVGFYKDDYNWHEYYDVNYRELLHKKEGNLFSSYFNQQWSYFGYHKEWIFENTIMLMLIFFGINMFLYPGILYKGYLLEHLEKADYNAKRKRLNPWVQEMIEIYHSFLFTQFIFWGVKLSLEKLRISHIGYTIIVLLEFLGGLICLGYIANIIITK